MVREAGDDIRSTFFFLFVRLLLSLSHIKKEFTNERDATRQVPFDCSFVVRLIIDAYKQRHRDEERVREKVGDIFIFISLSRVF